MTKELLSYINTCLENASVPYEFMRWTKTLTVPFFVGEYSEETPLTEDGLEQGVFILTGTTNNSLMELETFKETIKTLFPDDATTAILDNGSGVAVSYSNSFPVPTGEQGLFRIQINLNYKEWKVN